VWSLTGDRRSVCTQRHLSQTDLLSPIKSAPVTVGSLSGWHQWRSTTVAPPWRSCILPQRGIKRSCGGVRCHSMQCCGWHSNVIRVRCREDVSNNIWVPAVALYRVALHSTVTLFDAVLRRDVVLPWRGNCG